MEKKLTKKELKAMEEKQDILRTMRGTVIGAIKDYWTDTEATERYYKINQPDKLDYYGHLSDEEKEKILRHYSILDFVKVHYDKDDPEDRMWWFLRMMVETFNEFNKYRSETRDLIIDYKFEKDAIWNNDIIWNDTQLNLYMKLCKKFGYTTFIYTNASTGALCNITSLIKMGAKVIGTCTDRYHKEDEQGLVLDISEVNTDTNGVEFKFESVVK